VSNPSTASYRSVAVCRPGNFTDLRGRRVRLTAEDLAAVAANFDAAFHMPTVNLDHREDGPALGVVEGFSVASVIKAADAAVKAADVQLMTVHLAMAIGGKGFVSFTGDVAAVEEAVQVGAAVIEKRGLLVEKVVIPRPRREIVREFV